jgi:SAM-dependent methyltransferase
VTSSPTPKLDKDALRHITEKTIGHYDGRAQDFWDGTRDHDVTQNRATLLRHIKGNSPFNILDFGCGPGRDLAAFKDLGHLPVGIDGAENFCRMARAHTDCEVLHQNFLQLDLPNERFDGVFANAVLFHIPTQELARVLGDLRGTLKPGGVLFASNPRGQNEEGWQETRYGAYHDHEAWNAIVTDCGFEALEHYYRPPGKPREQQPWLATAFRKA